MTPLLPVLLNECFEELFFGDLPGADEELSQGFPWTVRGG